ncbi:hypothetical protein SAMN05421636_1291, partial [Pricia antarctica]
GYPEKIKQIENMGTSKFDIADYLDSKEMIAELDRADKVNHLGRMKVSIANQLLKTNSIEV